ncbi:unnamed protein product [Cylindrotheca closterium]|uniref:Phosphoglycerate mutase n=1 Tax=Cylindrotheca closterium TaxID=2856 RepID=A0AAD2FJD6_9STRA|nr:unnamed protein product [Cylindrotheca closterium]
MSVPEESVEKTIYLIRHAESEENRRIGSLKNSLRTLGRFRLPSLQDAKAVGELLNIPAQIDSIVSDIGKDQISDMKAKLDAANFLETFNVKLVVHSPLIRARETSEGMLGCVAPETKVGAVNRVVELAELIEMTPKEWIPMYRGQFKGRVEFFEKWLHDQPEDTIAVVGHSEFFKAMLGLDFKFGNCDVWKLTFNYSKKGQEMEDTTSEQICAPKKKPSSADFKEGEQLTTYILPPQWSNVTKIYTGKKVES